jgi:hypothetical protein
MTAQSNCSHVACAIKQADREATRSWTAGFGTNRLKVYAAFLPTHAMLCQQQGSRLVLVSAGVLLALTTADRPVEASKCYAPRRGTCFARQTFQRHSVPKQVSKDTNTHATVQTHSVPLGTAAALHCTGLVLGKLTTSGRCWAQQHLAALKTNLGTVLLV